MTEFSPVKLYDIDETGESVAVMAMPVIHAPWEWITENKYRCSCCYTQTRVDEVMGKPIYRVCPYCAAFMDEEE